MRISSLIVAITVLLVAPYANSQQPGRAPTSQKKFAISKEKIRELVPPHGWQFRYR